MKFDKTKAEKNARRSFWFKNELLVTYVTLLTSFLFIFPWIYQKNIFDGFSSTHILPLIFLLSILFLLAGLISFTQISRFTLKNKDAPLQQNFYKAIIFVVIMLVVAFFLLTEQMNYFGSDLKQPAADIDFLGRQFDFGNNRSEGKWLFQTIAYTLLVYLGLTFLNLRRIQR